MESTTKKKSDPPNLDEALRLLMGRPSGLQRLQKFHIARPRSLKDIARSLNTTTHALRRVLSVPNMADVKKLNWKRGRPFKKKMITTEMARWATNK